MPHDHAARIGHAKVSEGGVEAIGSKELQHTRPSLGHKLRRAPKPPGR